MRHARALIALGVTIVALAAGAGTASATGLGDVIDIGSQGDVRQSNENGSGDAVAGNANGTWQSNEQVQEAEGGKAESGDARGGDGGGCGCDGGGDGGDADSSADASVDQDADASNENETGQEARASSGAVQVVPVNSTVSVDVLSKGDDGDVRQSNANESGDAVAGNWNETGQSNSQSQSGTGGQAASGDARGGDGSSGGDGGDADSSAEADVDQSADASNENATEQKAEAGSHAVQLVPINSNLDVDIANHGDDGRRKGCGCHDRSHAESGDIRQSNANESGDAFAGNRNRTHQSNEQSQQAHGGKATSGDARGGDAGSGCCHEKKKKGNESAWSHEKRWHGDCCQRDGGDGGDAGSAADASVEQDADASNDNWTGQNARARSKSVQFLPFNSARGFPALSGPRPNGQRR